jgi:PelA/Pel-15E family pectate lyase
MERRAFLEASLWPLAIAAGCRPAAECVPPAPAPSRPSAARAHEQRVLSGMKQAVRFMTESVSHRGGYVWTYLSDFSRSWGELEARRSMLWVQPPGTPSVGNVFLDAYHATGDEAYYAAAAQVADALIRAQLPSGGWNYVYDFEGEAALASWYASVGRNAWRLEEFRRNPGNSTFDDACTASAGEFLLRMAIERQESRYLAATRRVLGLIEQSQYPSGGWPQRYPLEADYTRYVTLNDDVLGQNVELLLLAHLALGDPTYVRLARAAMDCLLNQQQPLPQPAWGLQHSLEGRPAAARTYEPAALVTHATARSVQQLMKYYEISADQKYLKRVPEALAWLDKVALSPELAERLGGTHPTFIEPGTDAPLYVHRRGSNVFNGAYYVDRSPVPRLAHYNEVRTLDVGDLRERYGQVTSTPAPGLARCSERGAVPRYFARAGVDLLGPFLGREPAAVSVSDEQVVALLDQLSPEGAWLTPLEFTSNPYRGEGSPEPNPSDEFASTHVGDHTDTSPYRFDERPRSYPAESAPLGISVAVFIQHLSTLIAYLNG